MDIISSVQGAEQCERLPDTQKVFGASRDTLKVLKKLCDQPYIRLYLTPNLALILSWGALKLVVTKSLQRWYQKRNFCYKLWITN